MHINYTANQLSSSGAMRIAACCQLNLCSMFVGVKMFSQLTHLCYPAECGTVPALPGRDMGTVLTWPSVPPCQALALREISQDPSPAPCQEFLAEKYPRLVQNTDSAPHPGKMSLAETGHPYSQQCFFTSNGGHRPRRAVGGLWRTTAQP